jgi:hypothetical protein
MRSLTPDTRKSSIQKEPVKTRCLLLALEYGMIWSKKVWATDVVL